MTGDPAELIAQARNIAAGVETRHVDSYQTQSGPGWGEVTSLARAVDLLAVALEDVLGTLQATVPVVNLLLDESDLLLDESSSAGASSDGAST